MWTLIWLSAAVCQTYVVHSDPSKADENNKWLAEENERRAEAYLKFADRVCTKLKRGDKPTPTKSRYKDGVRDVLGALSVTVDKDVWLKGGALLECIDSDFAGAVLAGAKKRGAELSAKQEKKAAKAEPYEPPPCESEESLKMPENKLMRLFGTRVETFRVAGLETLIDAWGEPDVPAKLTDEDRTGLRKLFLESAEMYTGQKPKGDMHVSLHSAGSYFVPDRLQDAQVTCVVTGSLALHDPRGRRDPLEHDTTPDAPFHALEYSLPEPGSVVCFPGFITFSVPDPGLVAIGELSMAADTTHSTVVNKAFSHDEF